MHYDRVIWWKSKYAKNRISGREKNELPLPQAIQSTFCLFSDFSTKYFTDWWKNPNFDNCLAKFCCGSGNRYLYLFQNFGEKKIKKRTQKIQNKLVICGVWHIFISDFFLIWSAKSSDMLFLWVKVVWVKVGGIWGPVCKESFFQPKHHNVQLIVHLNIRAPVGANYWGFCNPQLPDPKEALLFFPPPPWLKSADVCTNRHLPSNLPFSGLGALFGLHHEMACQ